MAFFSPSCLISEIRGSVGDQTFSRNAHGNIVKQKLVQTVTNTESQLTARARFASVVSAWQQLSEPDRRLWLDYATNFTRHNSLGVKGRYTGYNLFISLNLNRLMGNLPILSIPVQRSACDLLHNMYLSTSPYPITVNAEFDTSYSSIRIIIYFTPPISPNIRQVNPSLFIFNGSMSPNFAATDSVPTLWNESLMGMPFPTIPGTVIWLRYRLIDFNSGWFLGSMQVKVTI